MLFCPTCGRHYGAGATFCPRDGTPLRADATVAVRLPTDPLVGRVLDEKYRLDARLGEGGMGTVYRATHLLIDRPVAVKVLHQRFVEDEDAQARFKREARAAGRLQHVNAVAVTDFGRTPDGLVYLVMELLEGHDLRDVLTYEAPLEVGRALALMLQTAAAVEAAHEGGVIHRDLKPANIFIVLRRGAPETVKVLDFGIAKLAAESMEEAETNQLTQTGVMIGTPRYMSPEQCDGAKLSPASDVYSLGIILYEMLTGATPFAGTSPLAVALQHSTKPPRRPRELVPAIPEEIERVVLHALEKDPADRPADAGEFRRELYEAARRGGLEPAAAPIAPAVEAALDRAESATPSGRLVFDLERMRERGPAPNGRGSETTVLAEGAGGQNPPPADGNAGADGQAATAGGRRAFAARRGVTRLRIPLGGRQAWLYWLRQPPVFLTLAATALALAVGTTTFLRTRSSRPVTPEANANVAATPAPTPAATPTPTPADEKKSARGRRDNRAPARPRKKEDSKVGGVLKKFKKIFKNPF